MKMAMASQNDHVRHGGGSSTAFLRSFTAPTRRSYANGLDLAIRNISTLCLTSIVKGQLRAL
jgi:hypothetical protein